MSSRRRRQIIDNSEEDDNEIISESDNASSDDDENDLNSEENLREDEAIFSNENELDDNDINYLSAEPKEENETVTTVLEIKKKKDPTFVPKGLFYLHDNRESSKSNNFTGRQKTLNNKNNAGTRKSMGNPIEDRSFLSRY